MITRRRSLNSGVVPKDVVAQATITLKELPAKPKDDFSLREAIELAYDDITAALARGYTLEEVAAILTDQGIEINVSSLRYYLARINKEKYPATQPTTRRPRKSKQDAIATPESVEASPEDFAADESPAFPLEITPAEVPGDAGFDAAFAEPVGATDNSDNNRDDAEEDAYSGREYSPRAASASSRKLASPRPKGAPRTRTTSTTSTTRRRSQANSEGLN